MEVINVAIRVDGNSEIGIGHVLRCLTLAKKLSAYGIECIFFARNISKNLKNVIAEDFKLILLEATDNTFKPHDEYSLWLGVSQKLDANDFISTSSGNKFSLVIVDHYGLGAEWEGLVKEKFNNLIVLDDLANRNHICDLLIDQSIGREKKSYLSLVPNYCSILTGPTFSLLREEFRVNSGANNKKPFSMLLNFGGADKDNFTIHVLHILENSLLSSELSIKIIIGKDYPFKVQLLETIMLSRFRIILVENPTKMAVEIFECDFAIGAGGVSLLERAALGLPSILYVIAENQKHICLEYTKRNLGFLIERRSLTEDIDLISAVEGLLSKENLTSLSQANKDLVDFQGVSRVTAEVFRKFKLLKAFSASMDDVSFVYDCCNSRRSKKFHRNQKLFEYEQYKDWFKKALKNEKQKHLIYKIASVKLGYIKIDTAVVNGLPKVSVFLNEKFHDCRMVEILQNDVLNKFSDIKYL